MFTRWHVIISQANGHNWLETDLAGNLRAALTNVGADPKVLSSQTQISDGQWHHVALVHDGSHRTLYADGIQVARDTQVLCLLLSFVSYAGFRIGAPYLLHLPGYWSGLIDDVRIYNRAILL